MNKITVIGNTSSGKTCFLYAMYNYIAYGYIDGFTMSASNPIQDQKLQDAFDQLENAQLGNERFPHPSQEREQYNFSLQYGFREIASFEWADYPGGYIGQKEDDLTSDLRTSDAWVIFIDGEKLYKAIKENDDRKKKIACIKACGAYNKFITDLRSKGAHIPKSIPIIVTKGDLIINSSIENAKDLIIDCVKIGISSLFVNLPAGDASLVSISIVSLGNEIAENNYSGELDPINIEYPITISMLSILNNLFDNRYFKIRELKDLIEKENSKFFSKQRKIEAWNDEINAIVPDITRWQKMAQAILDTLSDDKKLYTQGQEISLVEYYQTEFLIK
ncbi:MAG: hypothetical protein R3Y68_02145 [Rikenellaceae bacterium]